MKNLFFISFELFACVIITNQIRATPYSGLSRPFCEAYLEKIDASASANLSSSFDQEGHEVAPADLPTQDKSEAVDADGNPLTPADLQDAPALITRETLSFPIYFDLKKYRNSNIFDGDNTLDHSRPPVFFDKMALGRITINPDGKLTFEGQALTPDDEQLFEKDCRQLLAKHAPEH
ncbi:MAG: hypothetical protein ACK5TR_09185 [Alphaproteobacteria bacterium]|jgi:hypothetical protein|nr:hypothetical protein [Alphaproteobacteria bacterium]